MRTRSSGLFIVFLLAGLSWLVPGSARAQADVDQTVDQVAAFGRLVQDMAFNDPNSTRPDVADYADLGLPGEGPGGFGGCKIAPRGLYCLATRTETSGSFQVVRFWKDPKSRPNDFKDLLRCDDAGLGFQGKRGRFCTGLTVDLSGAIWISGSGADGQYKLLKVAQPPAVQCGTSPWSANLEWPASNPLCAAQFGGGAGVLADIDVVDGQELAGPPWPFGYGVLALRDGIDTAGKPVSEALFFGLHSPGSAPHNFGSWLLGPGERLTSASLLKLPQTTVDPARYFVLATTSTRRVLARAATDPAPAAGSSQVFGIGAWESGNPGSATLSLGYANWAGCNGLASCTVDGATLTATGGSFQTKSYAAGGLTGLGVSGATGGEIDVNEKVDVAFPAPRKVAAIQILFLFNGPEYGDPAEKVKVTADGVSYLLTTRAGTDNFADWDGPGTVAPCGRTALDDSGCFVISDPFPSAVGSLTFEAVSVVSSGNNSDFAIGQIETNDYVVRTSATTGRSYLSNRDFRRVLALATSSASPLALALAASSATGDPFVLSTAPEFPDGITVAPGNRIDLAKDCPTPIDANGEGGCVATYARDGSPAAKFGAVKLAGDSTASGVEVFKVVGMPDCRYVPQVCHQLLYGGTAASDDAARVKLITDGVIVPLTTNAADRLEPAAQQLNVARLLPEDVTSQFDMSGMPPGGYPDPMLVSNLYRGPAVNGHYFDGLFFRLEDGLRFAGPFDGEFDVSDLTDGRYELGCEDVFDWDAIVRVPDTRPGPAAGVFVGTLVNVGCRNPTKIITSETSFFPFLEVAPDTYGPTVTSRTAVVTLNNDGRFARLAQSLYEDLNTSRLAFVCSAGDGQSAAPLSAAVCRNLQKFWSAGKQKLNKCVDAAFQPKSSASNENCQSFRNQLDFYRAALPAAPTGPDPGNRLAEQVWRVAVFSYVFESKFLPSIPANGYCAESGTCPP